MLNLDRAATETLLERLEEEGYLFSQYQLYKVNGQPRLLGKGGFSVVYEMIYKNAPEKHYAMKVIGLEKHTITSDAFQRTTNLQRYLNSQSPCILQIIDEREIYVSLDEEGKLAGVYEKKEESWNREGIPLQFILMEKLESILVKDRFKNTTLISADLQEEKEVLKFAMQIGGAILTAHNNNVLHRDVKLENMFWDEEEKRYKLGDFGIAKYVEEGNAETIVYTDGYGAPEIERRLSDSYHVTADIYSFGISLYLLLNKLKFPGSGGYYVNLVQYDPNFVFPAPENASTELTRVIRKMCSYRREERYQSMAEALFDLQYVGEMAGIFQDENEIELMDAATETYHEEKTEREEERDVSNLSRVQKKQRKKEIEQNYNSTCIRYMTGLAILFALFIQGMQTEVSFVTNWQFWIFPAVVLVTSIMQQMKEFHLLFGIAAILTGIYSAYCVGVWAPHLILLICVAVGVPALTAAAGIGTGIWLWLALTDKLSWFDFIDRCDLCWLIIVIILLSADRLMRLRHAWNKTGSLRMHLWQFCYGMLPFLIIVLGILLFLLQQFKIYTVPEPVSKIHLIRTGAVLIMASIFRMWQSGELDDGMEKTEEDGEEIAEEDVHMEE